MIIDILIHSIEYHGKEYWVSIVRRILTYWCYSHCFKGVDDCWTYFDKNSNQPESNQRPKDNHRTLQSSALPTELWLVLTRLGNYKTLFSSRYWHRFSNIYYQPLLSTFDQENQFKWQPIKHKNRFSCWIGMVIKLSRE